MNARIEKYLKAYNLVQFTGWLLALLILPVDFIISFFIICTVQLLSVLEILHAYKKWSNSSALLCFLQIGARLIILLFTFVILISFHKDEKAEIIIHIMFFAWCTAEIIRYAYYMTELFKMKHSGLLWLRYTAFIICYPIGLICELFILVDIFMTTSSFWTRIFIIFILIAYAITFPKLYLYLLKQRRRKLLNS